MEVAVTFLGISSTVITIVGGMLFSDGHHREIGLWVEWHVNFYKWFGGKLIWTKKASLVI